jgi:hypothetical protein
MEAVAKGLWFSFIVSDFVYRFNLVGDYEQLASIVPQTDV